MSDSVRINYMKTNERIFYERIQSTINYYNANPFIKEKYYWIPNQMLGFYKQCIEYFNSKRINICCIDEKGIMHFSIIEQAVSDFIISSYIEALKAKLEGIDELLDNEVDRMHKKIPNSRQHEKIIDNMNTDNIMKYIIDIIRQYYQKELQRYIGENKVSTMTKFQKLMTPTFPIGKNSWLKIIEPKNLDNMRVSLIKLGVNENKVLALIGEIVADNQKYNTLQKDDGGR